LLVFADFFKGSFLGVLKLCPFPCRRFLGEGELSFGIFSGPPPQFTFLFPCGSRCSSGGGLSGDTFFFLVASVFDAEFTLFFFLV